MALWLCVRAAWQGSAAREPCAQLCERIERQGLTGASDSATYNSMRLATPMPMPNKGGMPDVERYTNGRAAHASRVVSRDRTFRIDRVQPVCMEVNFGERRHWPQCFMV